MAEQGEDFPIPFLLIMSSSQFFSSQERICRNSVPVTFQDLSISPREVPGCSKSVYLPT
jgi:hypothetical protein